MAVSAGVVGDNFMSTVRATVNMASQFSGAAYLNSPHCPPLFRRDRLAEIAEKYFPILTENISHFQSFSSHRKKGNYKSGRESKGLVVSFKSWTAMWV